MTRGIVIALALLAIAGISAGYALIDELLLRRLEHTVAESASATSAITDLLTRCALTSDERRLRLCGVAFAGRADADRVGEPAPVTANARAIAHRLVTAQPASGFDRVLLAFALSRGVPDQTDDAVGEMARSYRLAPFPHEQGYWRIWYGAHHWGALDPATRTALLHEAVWLQDLGRADRDAVHAAVRGTPPFVAIALRSPGRGGEDLPLSASSYATTPEPPPPAMPPFPRSPAG